MKVAITGASGFLGSHLLNKLQSEGHDVLPITSITQDPIQRILEYKPDVVVHCAWRGGNNYKDINSTSQITNVVDALELLNVLVSSRNDFKFVGFGSFAEYGELSNLATEEDVEKPTNMYGLSKLTLKNYSENLCTRHNIPWVWIRPCYVYGPGDVHTRLVPLVMQKLIDGQDIFLDSCDKVIDYIFIDDFINYAYSVVTEPAHGVYNICSGHQYPLREVMQTIAELLNAPERIHYDSKELRNLTSKYICGSNLKIKQLTSFKKTTSLRDGLQKTIKYHIDNNEKRNNY
jgi:nucleoside-diphosphate-sugar epimerase